MKVKHTYMGKSLSTHHLQERSDHYGKIINLQSDVSDAVAMVMHVAMQLLRCLMYKSSVCAL